MRLALISEKKSDMFSEPHPFYAIFEVASSSDSEAAAEDSERLMEFIESVSDNILDGIVPQGE